MAEAIIGAVGLVVVALLSLMAVRSQVRASREANADTVTQGEQETAVKALESMTLNLLEPYRKEVDLLRKQIATDREEHTRRAAADKAERERKERAVSERITKQSERIDLLTIEVKHWKSMAKAIARWATTLRDQVISLGGSVPTIPDELLMAQLLDDDDTTP